MFELQTRAQMDLFLAILNSLHGGSSPHCARVVFSPCGTEGRILVLWGHARNAKAKSRGR